jgi:hypothetical protein
MTDSTKKVLIRTVDRNDVFCIRVGNSATLNDVQMAILATGRIVGATLDNMRLLRYGEVMTEASTIDDILVVVRKDAITHATQALASIRTQISTHFTRLQAAIDASATLLSTIKRMQREIGRGPREVESIPPVGNTQITFTLSNESGDEVTVSMPDGDIGLPMLQKQIAQALRIKDAEVESVYSYAREIDIEFASAGKTQISSQSFQKGKNGVRIKANVEYTKTAAMIAQRKKQLEEREAEHTLKKKTVELERHSIGTLTAAKAIVETLLRTMGMEAARASMSVCAVVTDRDFDAFKSKFSALLP